MQGRKKENEREREAFLRVGVKKALVKGHRALRDIH